MSKNKLAIVFIAAVIIIVIVFIASALFGKHYSNCMMIREDVPVPSQQNSDKSNDDGFTVTIQAKDNCVPGQYSDPKIENGMQVVDIMNSQCAVFKKIKCPITCDMHKEQGAYECS